MEFRWPLMKNNITAKDLDILIKFLKNNHRLTQSDNVKVFEREWSKWLGVKYSIYVNSGSSANLLTMNVLKDIYGSGEIIVPALTWVSDISSVLQNGFNPIFVDINSDNMCMNDDQVIDNLSDKTKAVFITYTQGFNGLTDKLLSVLKKRNIPLIEDVCQAHGATFKGKRLGSFGLMSNFSFYFGHHMSTIEGGMICTNDEKIYEIVRMLRSHGMVREAAGKKIKQKYKDENPDLHPYFIFAYPGYNVRGTEIGGVLGRNQIKRLDDNNIKRRKNFEVFLNNLDSNKYRTNFDLEGSCNFAFNLIIKKPDVDFRDKVENLLYQEGVEYRRGSSGGGNQLRQPYLKKMILNEEWKKYPEVEHIHFYGYYIGNYPDIEEQQIISLCKKLNKI
jgi:CDP-4-dehydro-6-deoxyglucose reductase, E1